MIAATPRSSSERREAELAGRGHGEDAAENDDRDLDVELRPHRLLDAIGEAAAGNWR